MHSASTFIWVLAINAAALAVIVHRFGDPNRLNAFGDAVRFVFRGDAQAVAPTSCGILPNSAFVVSSSRVVLPDGIRPAYVTVQHGKIVAVHNAFVQDSGPLLEFGNALISPGLIDLHVHLNEPGRETWEGVTTGTAAAAAGGITTVVDMPLNSDPVTVTPELLQAKVSVGKAKAHVNVAYWAGLTPENAHRPEVLDGLLAAGAIGFKSFMSPSGIEDFANVSRADMAAAVAFTKARGVPYYVHAELVTEVEEPEGSPSSYATYLATRPPKFERDAVQLLVEVLDNDHSEAAPGFALHVAHLSDAGCLPLILEARKRHAITVETCPHYLLFASDEVADGNTLLKCAPPLRGTTNRAALRAAAAATCTGGGGLDLIASDHSPAPLSLKQVDTGHFLQAWGGISGLQYLLPATWTALKAEPGFDLACLSRLLSTAPAELAGLSHRKGRIAPGYDADLVVWDPEAAADTSALANQHRHKASPYTDVPLLGRVLATIVNGQAVSLTGQNAADDAPCGRVLLRGQLKGSLHAA